MVLFRVEFDDRYARVVRSVRCVFVVRCSGEREQESGEYAAVAYDEDRFALMLRIQPVEHVRDAFGERMDVFAAWWCDPRSDLRCSSCDDVGFRSVLEGSVVAFSEPRLV